MTTTLYLSNATKPSAYEIFHHSAALNPSFHSYSLIIMLTFQNLSYSYRSGYPVLKNVNAAVSPGICLLLGENGAGKTTLLGLSSGLLRTASGFVEFDGECPGDRLPSTMSDIFYLSDSWQSPFKDIYTTARFHGAFYPNLDLDMLASNLEAFGLTGREKLKSLSLGMRRKTYIAYALALKPRLLLLDEPANGLDIDSKKELRRMVSRCIGDDQTVIISTHTVADLEVLYDTIMLLHKGELLLSVSTALVSEKLGFVTSSMPIQEALYMETEGASFNAIVRAESPYGSAIDFELLYSAIVSGKAPEIIEILKEDGKQ